MNVKDMMSEIKDANLNYLMMAKQLISADKATAMFLLGVSKEIADLLDSLSNVQVVKLSSTNMMLTRFRFDDSAVLGMLTNYSKERQQAHLHTSILLASQSAEEIT
ncbi:MAG: flagellar transcriptional regulator FlhD [Methylotenera sp.]|jgi:flagellar transcriptional activator FlhD|nr:flagellar transcriptional regulator FlhD [Methylotenera sp.]MDO9050730.1 flagellar transcriptional regulator FlhD [Methylotenera sp.]MDO9232434.1 flagellar transcriptional regulator FlhD [Methylotenera sp.]MDO9282109.1 flagellar transcriptional regulator FlhD [Methylotenera sp.]MDO9389966.1 flagellar transcriptional regulator FlhD [Methylotenera sp.]